MQNIDASLEAVEEIFAALLDISRLDTGAMKPEMADFRIDELLQRLDVEFAPLAREKGLDLRFMPCSLTRALGPAAAAAAVAKLRFQRDQIHARGQRADRVPPPRQQAPHRRLRHRHRHSAFQTPRGIQGIPSPRSGRAGGARRRLGPFDRRAHCPRARLRGGVEIRRRPRLPVFGRSAARRTPRLEPAVAPCGPMPGGSPARWRCASTTTAAFSTAWKSCLVAGAAACSRRPISPKRWRRSRPSGLEPDGLLVDYHLDGGNGVGAIARTAPPSWPHDGRDLPAILITADRSLHVREEARLKPFISSTSRSSRHRCAP